MLASHKEIRTGSIIRNGTFVIRCKINFKIDLDKLQIPLPLREDSCIVKLDRKTLQTYTPGCQIAEQKRTVDGITWWIEYYPCGYRENDKEYKYHQKTIRSLRIGVKVNGLRTHKQCMLADNKDDVIELVCNIKLSQPIQKVPKNLTPASNKTAPVNKVNKTCCSDAITFSFLECQLEYNEGGDYNSTDMKFAKGSNKHQWHVLHFPAGILAPSKGYIGLIVEATTTDTNTVFMNGVIRIEGSPFEKKFEMLVENDSSLSFPKLISHEDLRRNGGIFDSKISITCEVTFEDHLFMI